MKSKTVVSVIILLLTALTSLGLVACGADSTPVPGKTEIPDESTHTPQAPGEDIHKSTPVTGEIETPGEPTKGFQAPNEETLNVEDAYRDEIAAITIELSTVFFSLDEMLVSPDFENGDWISEVSLATSDIMTLCEEAGDLAPPESMTETHVAYLETMMHFNDAIATLLRGLDEANTDLINQASAEMWFASEILTEFTTLLE